MRARLPPVRELMRALSKKLRLRINKTRCPTIRKSERSTFRITPGAIVSAGAVPTISRKVRARTCQRAQPTSLRGRKARSQRPAEAVESKAAEPSIHRRLQPAANRSGHPRMPRRARTKARRTVHRKIRKRVRRSLARTIPPKISRRRSTHPSTTPRKTRSSSMEACLHATR
jgi:hypothetical protein